MPQRVDRRHFMQQASALAAAGTGLAATGRALAQSAPQRVVVGVMGLSRGQGLAETFAGQENVEVRVLMRRGPTAGQSLPGGAAAPRELRAARSVTSAASWTTLKSRHWFVPPPITGMLRPRCWPCRPRSTCTWKNRVATTRRKGNGWSRPRASTAVRCRSARSAAVTPARVQQSNA